uniref:MRH domain-containing protein n=1 Tax=Odontella aurita TaxID=265563 RepID=A0A7S4NB29_9STRA
MARRRHRSTTRARGGRPGLPARPSPGSPLLWAMILLQNDGSDDDSFVIGRGVGVGLARASSASSLFPPSHDEYDDTVFDPRSMFGAPYGGYARATRSRLAKLPLRLVGGAGFDLPPLVAEDGDAGERAGGGDPAVGSDGGEGGMGSDVSEGRSVDGGGEGEGGAGAIPHFQLSDGQGRRFVCRPYHEDELEAESVIGSMFDAPVLRKIPLGASDEYDGDGGEPRADLPLGGAGGSKAFGASSEEDYVHMDNRIPASRLGHVADAAQLADEDDPLDPMNMHHTGRSAGRKTPPQQQQQQQRRQLQQPKKRSTVPIHASDIANQLKKLKGFCAQIHLGWWSYEWCHEASLSQFHVKVTEQQQKAAATGHTSGARRFEIESVTDLGKYHQRKVQMDDGNGGMPPNYAKPPRQGSAAAAAPSMGGGGAADAERGLSGSIVVTDTFEDGDWCDEAGVHRATKVEIRCCKEAELKALRQVTADAKAAASRLGGDVDAVDTGSEAMFLSVFEPKGQVCQYRARICTPLLCPDAFRGLEGGERFRGDQIGAFDDDDQGAFEEDVVEEDVDEGPKEDVMPPSANEAQGPSSHREFMPEDRPAKRGKESIRGILERTLGNHCLQRNAGWWTYELCHTRHVREFHGANKIDMVTGVSHQVVEEENMLGHYDVDVLESFPDEEEVNYVVNATDSFSDLGPKKKKTVPAAGTPSPDAGSNGAVFVQEYLHGDVCEDPDVTDSVVKAGGIVDGGIQRATTVRFSCGKNYELVKVNEDSTCHYVFDVTVPALCKHPLFKAPVVKTQVVKCLPIDDL